MPGMLADEIRDREPPSWIELQEDAVAMDQKNDISFAVRRERILLRDLPLVAVEQIETADIRSPEHRESWKQ